MIVSLLRFLTHMPIPFVCIEIKKTWIITAIKQQYFIARNVSYWQWRRPGSRSPSVMKGTKTKPDGPVNQSHQSLDSACLLCKFKTTRKLQKTYNIMQRLSPVVPFTLLGLKRQIDEIALDLLPQEISKDLCIPCTSRSRWQLTCPMCLFDCVWTWKGTSRLQYFTV